MLPPAGTYDELYRRFRWQIPPHYNIGVDCADRWAAIDPGRLAILHVRADGRTDEITYGWLRDTSNRVANVL
ncbi:MAG: acetyl-CoA synthetase, partial [Variibacter sp.]|nr:acetyl-CoA synthetase [Variibacter sp.]